MTENPVYMHKTNENVKTIQMHISDGNITEALYLLDKQLEISSEHVDELYYLRGNAYRKLSNWQMALNNYQKAIELNPASPAAHAREMIMNILEFYNKDMYNQ